MRHGISTKHAKKKNTIDIPKPEYVDSLEQRASLDYLDYNKPVFYPTIKP